MERDQESDGNSKQGKRGAPGQVVELFLLLAKELGLSSDREIAECAGVSPENVANWRSGSVREFKVQTLKTIERRLSDLIRALAERAGVAGERSTLGLCPIEIEDGASPAELQRQFRDRVAYDYLGHRFLYYEPMGAIAWENLIKRGYEQDCWLRGVDRCASDWLGVRKDSGGRAVGPIAGELGIGKRSVPRGLEVVSLGPGEGGKECLLLERITEMEFASGQKLAWFAFAPIDVSIPLLLSASKGAQRVLDAAAARGTSTGGVVRAFSADFEEGGLSFLARLPSANRSHGDGLRLLLMLGNTFGNLRDEEMFVRKKLHGMARKGDLVWLEVGLRLDPISNDPLFDATREDRQGTAGETNRRLLLEGPYRRWEAASGRSTGAIDIRIWLREGDETCRVPGSVNFCHDLQIKEERRACTMLYSRRYQLDELMAWFEALGFAIVRVEQAVDSSHRARIAHLLLRKS